MVKTPYTKLQSQARKKYVTVKEFQEQYSLSKTKAYQLIHLEEMQPAVMNFGEGTIRIDLDLAFEIITKLYN